jgi:hypothetical protein
MGRAVFGFQVVAVGMVEGGRTGFFATLAVMIAAQLAQIPTRPSGRWHQTQWGNCFAFISRQGRDDVRRIESH